MRPFPPLVAAAGAALLAAASAGLSWWVGVQQCRMGVGLAVRTCAPWAAATGGAQATAPEAVLELSPTDAPAYRRLASAAEATGQDERAARLYGIALRRAPRELATREWAFRRAVAAGRMEVAAREFDALLRLDEASAPRRLASAGGFLRDADFREVLAQALRQAPPWRSLLPAVLEATPHPVETEALLASVADTGRTAAEAALHARLLERLGRWADARSVWRDALPAGQKAFDRHLFDGGFEAGVTPPPYGWQFESQPGTIAGVDGRRAFEGGQSLSVAFEGRPVDFTGVWQDLALSPGRYRFAVRATVELAGRRPLTWTVACRPNEMELTRLQIGGSNGQWRASGVVFEVPARCPAQRLRLTSIGRDLAERAVPGEAWFDALAIERFGTR